MKYQAGLLLPWTKPPYGYRLNPDRPRDPTGVWVDEAEAAIVRDIFAWFASDSSSLCALAEHLQVQGVLTPSGKRLWSISTLRAILRQPAYLGQVYACRHRYRPAQVRRSGTHLIGRPHDSFVERPEEEWIPVGAVPTIVTQEQFDLVQARLAQNQSFASRNN
jgi:site-specific DNA recombinase